MSEFISLMNLCSNIAREAGEAIMRVYDSGDYKVETKEDDTPVTYADKLANGIIEVGLKKISDWPILSEEGSHNVDGASRFWCVDPIDGTKEFIAKNGEFTVNIGLIENGEPILGVVSAPAKNVLYYGARGYGAFKQAGTDEPIKIEAKFTGPVPVVTNHQTVEKELEELLGKIGEHQMLIMGSSLKFCLVAEGAAAMYPRFYGSHLWDTAAGDAVLRAAGGKIEPELVYDPTELLNPNFITTAGNFKL